MVTKDRAMRRSREREFLDAVKRGIEVSGIAKDGERYEVAIVDAMPAQAVKAIDLAWRQSSAGNETFVLIFERKSGAGKNRVYLIKDITDEVVRGMNAARVKEEADDAAA